MNKFRVIVIALLLLAMGSALEISADERPAYDVVLIIDKSLSMEESKNLEVVKTFMATSVIEEKVKIGDFLILMDFWGQAEVVDSFNVETKADKEKAKSIISTIISNKRETNTDIGNAIDVAKAQIDVLACSTRPKIVLMVTDGIQEAPRFSKYYSPNGQFTNAFLAQATTIAKQGWKIQMIEIGGAKDFMGAGTSKATSDKTVRTTDAGDKETGAKKEAANLKETTEKMGGDYKGVSEEPTAAELEAAVEGLETRIDVVEAPKRIVVPANKMTDITLKLKGEGLANDATVVVREVRLTAASMQDQDVLENKAAAQYSIRKDKETAVTTKLFIPATLSPGDYQADIQYYFEGGNVFYPKAFAVTLHVNNFIENNLLVLILVLAGGLILLGLLIFLLVKLIASSGTKFRLKVEEQPLKKGKDVFKVGAGKWLYLNESYGRLSIVPKRSLRSIGRVYGVKKGLEFEPLREEQFPGLKAAKQNVLGQKITVKTQDSAVLHVEFQKV
jgi:hypothetical protein